MPFQSRMSDDYDDYQRSRTDSTSPKSDSLWAGDEDLLAVPEFNSSAEQNADPMFPSPHMFNLMVQDYLRNLSPKKREKALLTQKMYDAVLAVLQDPKDTSTKTAQFRFWAKKMFQLTSCGGDSVICHDLQPVAVKEQIYEVLCHCHGQAGHGGRDKTSVQVRRYYSWIPKEIIARFVRDCPFCQSRRTQSSSCLGNMSESQAFLISLQSSESQSASKRSVSLAQARANAAALGHKPYRKPHIRTIDTCRSRRGSGMSDDYIHYNDGAMPPPSIHSQGPCPPGHERYYPMTMPIRPAARTRTNSYHEQGTLQVQMHPHEGMYRRASESSMFAEPQAQYLGVPGAPSAMSRGSVVRSSVDSLSDIRHFAQSLRFDADSGKQVKAEPEHASPTQKEYHFMNDHSAGGGYDPSMIYPELDYDTIAHPTYETDPHAGYDNIVHHPYDATVNLAMSYDAVSCLSASTSPTSAAVQGWQSPSTEDLVQGIFDSTNVFAVGEAAGMTTDQVMSMHETDSALLGELNPNDGQGQGQTHDQSHENQQYSAEGDISSDLNTFPVDEEAYQAFMTHFGTTGTIMADEEAVEVKLERIDYEFSEATTQVPSPVNHAAGDFSHAQDFSLGDSTRWHKDVKIT